MTITWLSLAACALLLSTVAPAARLVALAGATRLASPAAGRGEGGWPPAFRPASVSAGLGAAVVAFVMWRGGFALAVAVAAIGGLITALLRDRQRQRDHARRRRDLAEAVRVLVAELDAGSRPRTALAAAAGAGPSYRAVFTECAALAASGSDAAGPLLSDADTRPIGVAWRLGQATGLALAGVLTRVGTDLASRADQRRAVTVALSGPRSSAAVLTGLPAIGVVMGIAMGADPIGFLVDSSAGRAVCCAGVLLDIGGVLWVRRIVRAAART